MTNPISGADKASEHPSSHTRFTSCTWCSCNWCQSCRFIVGCSSWCSRGPHCASPFGCTTQQSQLILWMARDALPGTFFCFAAPSVDGLNLVSKLPVSVGLAAKTLALPSAAFSPAALAGCRALRIGLALGLDFSSAFSAFSLSTRSARACNTSSQQD